jgi:5'-phosphate synthase pdxT subunit
MVRVGVLSLQGAFHLHKAHLESLKAQYVEVSKEEHLESIDGLIIPGGESGVMLKL